MLLADVARSFSVQTVQCVIYILFCGWRHVMPQWGQWNKGVALKGRNRTVPPCSVGLRTGHAPGPAAADRSRALQTTTNDADRRQRAKQYWPIRRAGNNFNQARRIKHDVISSSTPGGGTNRSQKRCLVEFARCRQPGAKLLSTTADLFVVWCGLRFVSISAHTRSWHSILGSVAYMHRALLY